MSKRGCHIRSGDIVRVRAGNCKGAEGKVISLLSDKSRVLVEGVRMLRQHIRRSERYPEGGIVQREGSIHVSNLILIHRPAPRALRVKPHEA